MAAPVLDPEEFQRVLQIKTDANQCFSKGEYQRALDGWSAALKIYDGRLGSPEQRFEKGKLHSNKAEAALKLELYDVAVMFCTESLECNPVDHKARFRRARALLCRGGFEDLMLAQEDIQRIQKDGGTLGAAEAALLRTAKGPLLPEVAKTASASDKPTTTTTEATGEGGAEAPAEGAADEGSAPGDSPVVDTSAEAVAAAVLRAPRVRARLRGAAE